MTDSSELYTEMKVDDDLSSAMGTEILADRDLISPGFDNAPRVGFRYSCYACNVQRMRESLQQCQNIADTRKKYSGRRHYRGNRVLKSLVGSRRYSTAGRLAWSDAEGFNSHLLVCTSEPRIVEEP
jgi:hypothetical protein